MKIFQEFLVVTFIVLSINNKKVTGDALSESHHALSSQDGKISLMDYRPLLQLVRNGRQDYRFNRHAAVPVYHEDDYGRTNEIPNPSVIVPVSQGACPKINPLPAYECSKRRAKKNCWSVGQQDTDCPSPDGIGYGLCCFDGCSNSCQYGSGPSYGTPSTPAIPHKVSRPPGVPAPAPIQAPPTEPTLLATTDLKAAKAPIISNAHHSQEFASGAYNYGYNDGLSNKEEYRTPDGAVHGSYSYLDPHGRLITNTYVADASGFRSSISTSDGEKKGQAIGSTPKLNQHKVHAKPAASSYAPTLIGEAKISDATSNAHVKVSNIEEAQAYGRTQAYLDDSDYQDAFLNGDYVLDLNKAQSAHPVVPQAPIVHAVEPVHDHHDVPSNVLPPIPRNEQPRHIAQVSHLPSSEHRQHVAAQFAAHDASLSFAPEKGQHLNYQIGSPVSPVKYNSEPDISPYTPIAVAQPTPSPAVKTQAHISAVPKPQPPRQPVVATPSRHEYKPIAAVPVSHIEQPYQEALVSNGIAIPSHDANLRASSSIYEEVNLPTLKAKPNVGRHQHHHKKTQHLHETHDEDHYLEKLIKIANGELGDKYEVVKDKHNPHKARKGHKQAAVRKSPSTSRHTSNNDYTSSPKVAAKPHFDHFKASEHVHRAQNVQAQKEDPYYEVKETKPHVDEKYLNPAAYERNHFEPAKPIPVPVKKDPYYEVPKPKVSHETILKVAKPKVPHDVIPKAAHDQNSFIKDSEQKYRNPASQYGNGYEIQKLKKPSRTTESPYYDADVIDIEEEARGSLAHNDDYDYNGLKSEDRYFNVPLTSDLYGGQELSLIGVADELPSKVAHPHHHEEKHHRDHHKDEHHDKYKDVEVYSVTDLKKTNTGSGKQLNGAGYATKDGFYYTRTEEYDPSKSKEPVLQSFEGYQRPAKYTEEVIKPIVVEDNPFEELNKLLGSSDGQDEGPAYEYPEVIHGQGKYGDNVERHINGLKGHSVNLPPKSRPTKKGYSSTKSKHPGVYSFGKSMSTIPFSFHQNDDYREHEPSVLEQLARSHVNEGNPIRLSDSGSVSSNQEIPSGYIESRSHSSSEVLSIEPEYNHNQLKEDRERFPFIAAIENPSSDDFKDHDNEYSLKAKKSKAIKRRRKVVKQRRRGGYGGGRRRTARKVGSSEESLPFTPKEKQQYIKDTIERKKRHEQVERRNRLTSNFKSIAPPSKENIVYHSPNSYSYASFKLGASS